MRPAVTTLARWLFLLRSATLMASSMRPSRRAPATAGAKARDCLRAALYAMARSIMTPIDQPDIMNRMTTTIFAIIPHCAAFLHNPGGYPGNMTENFSCEVSYEHELLSLLGTS